MQIFLSYSRKDTPQWFQKYELIPFLKDSLATEKVNLWFDTDRDGIRAGEEWRKRIEAAIDESAIAILLVSQNFLNSDFIATFELPLIEDRAARGLLRVVPIRAGYCDYKSMPFLAARNTLPSGQPLIDFMGDDAMKERAFAEILSELRRDIREIRTASGKILTPPPLAVDDPSVDPDGSFKLPPWNDEVQDLPEVKPARRGLSRRLVLVAGCVAALALGGGVLLLPTRSTVSPERAKARDAFFGALPWLNWIVYDPSEYDPYKNQFPSEASIRSDIKVLRHYGFDGLVTTTAKGTLREIPRIAHEEGFQMVISGLWDPRDEAELAAALAEAEHVDAYCLGHCGLQKRYHFSELQNWVTEVRHATGKPVAVSELVGDYEVNPRLVALGDFLFPDAHGQWHGGQSPEDTWAETLALGRKLCLLSADTPDRPVLLKMVSYPSEGAPGLTPQAQVEFYRLAVEKVKDRTDLSNRVRFVFLGAFDTPWKTADAGWTTPEQHTGLFTQDRVPKPAVTEVAWTGGR